MRYFLGLIGFIALIVLVVVIVLHRGPAGTNKTSTGPKTVKLTDYIDKNSEVSLTIDGQINAEELHRVIRINVSPSQRTFSVFQGYDEHVLKQASFNNNQSAYDTFMRALTLLNFAKERSGVKQTDERGVCPAGNRYIYEVRENGEDVTKLWSASCSSSLGTAASVSANIRALFQKQIPDYDKLVADVRL